MSRGLSVKHMMSVLGKSKRKYTVKNIDGAPSGYFRINGWFDIEINPSLVRNEEASSVYLWHCYKKDGRLYTDPIADVRDVNIEDVDKVVSVWAKEVRAKSDISYLRDGCNLETIYSKCKPPYKIGIDK